MIKNTLHAPSTDRDLAPHFTMRDGGITINYVPKIHCEDPIVDDFSISFKCSDLWIPLKLNGALSDFHTRAPTDRELHECENYP